MFLPGQLEALVETRRDDLEREIRLQALLFSARGQRPGWRHRMARMLRWLGDRMVDWADRLAARAQVACAEAGAPVPVQEME